MRNSMDFASKANSTVFFWGINFNRSYVLPADIGLCGFPGGWKKRSQKDEVEYVY